MIKVLPAIKETLSDYDDIEKKIISVLRREIYFPMLKELQLKRKFLNAFGDAVKDAVGNREIVFSQGRFTGSFSGAVSRELRRMGATWDKKTKSFSIHMSSLPIEIQEAIRISYQAFRKRLLKIDDQLRQILPEEIAEKIKIEKNFQKALWKVDRSVSKTLKNITVLPQMSAERRHKIAAEWQDNMKLWIVDFTEHEIKKLRKEVREHVFKGGRYEELRGMIKSSYGVSERKARFLARQETSLLMTKFKETRYTEAGVNEYVWGCVAGSPNHPVRPSHKVLEGKTFKWSEPPVTTPPGEPERRNNPGQDYNCRCFAKPVVRF